MDAFLTRDDDEVQALDIDSLVATLLGRLGVHEFFGFTYKAAINTALIFGEANLIGPYIEEEFTLKLDLSEGIAVLSKPGEELQTYGLDQEAFEAQLEFIRQEVAAPDSKVYTPETLAAAIAESIGFGEEYISSYEACIMVATVVGDCRVVSKQGERIELVIHEDVPTASLFKDDVVIDSFKLDKAAFDAVRESYAESLDSAEEP